MGMIVSEYPNWFVNAEYNFKTYLAHFKNKPNLKFIQVGAFTGDATIWLLDNILTDESSLLVDVDTWKGSDEEEHKKMDFEDVHLTYLERTKKYNNLLSIVEDSSIYLSTVKPNYIDFIYIDGNHTEYAVRNDAFHSWEALKPGGILAFDDYLWQDNIDCPKPAIDWFLETYKDKITILEHNYQVWIRKNA
jgi:predicted O-methyltransferase YrrM